MKDINTREYAVAFCEHVDQLMKQFECVGNWKWGDPAGQSDGIPTYEIVTKDGKKVWCAIIEYSNSGTGEPNRRGILATFPVDKKKTLGSVMATMIPYEDTEKFNTRAYYAGDYYEIRNYGRVTVGREPIKRDDFFEYMNTKYPDLVFFDEKNKRYIKCYEYKKEMTKEAFAKQTYELTRLLAEFKGMYR